MAYSIEMLSLSKIGRLLKERLGDDASQYLFPDEFEQAVVDIGFCGVVIDGTSSPYDEIIFIGNGDSRLQRPGRTDFTSPFQKYKKATFIGTTEVPMCALWGQTELTDVVFNDGIVSIGYAAFQNCSSLDMNIVLPSSVVTIDQRAFMGTSITSISAPGVTTLITSSGNGNSTFYNCTSLKNVSFPKCVNYPGTGTGTAARGIFANCTALESVQLGSVGHGLPNPTGSTVSINANTFLNCTSAFTLTIYTDGGNVDALVTAARSGATNATIVIKASADTTYGGTSYSAGATIKTSTP